MKTLLNHNEAKFIDSIISSIPKSIQFSKIKEANKEFIVSDPNNTDKLRDFFIEMQQEIGFDQNYNLTKEGEILEKLIDKFFL